MKFCDPCWGLLHRVDSRMEYLFAYQFWYWELWVENLWGGERKHYFGNVGRWGLVRLVLYTSLHQSCTYSLPTLHIYSTSNRRHIWNLVEHLHHELFCTDSQRVKAVGYFRRRAPSCIFDRMFDRIVNGSLPNNILLLEEDLRSSFPTGVTQGNRGLPCLLILLIYTSNKENSSTTWVDKAYYVWLIVGQLPIKAGWWDAPPALRDFNRRNKRRQSSQVGSEISGSHCYYHPREQSWGLPDWLPMVTTTILSSDATETSHNILHTHS